MKILFMIRDAFYEANPSLIQQAQQFGQVRVLYTDQGIEKQQLLTEVADVDIIVVAVVKIDQEIIDAAKKLKYILKYGAGFDNIDVAYAFEKGIAVTNAPGYNAESVADHAFGLMLAASRNIPKKDEEMKRMDWSLSLGYETFGKRLGIIGFGSIGKAIARRASGFQMDVMAYGHHLDHEAAENLNVKFVGFEELLSTSDYIILSTSLTPKNKEMINKETLRLMKPSAFVINISRGGLINEVDLMEALRNQQIKGAALDVYAYEPPRNELALLENVVATPHIGGATYESIDRIGKLTIHNIRKFIDGEELDYLIKPKERNKL